MSEDHDSREKTTESNTQRAQGGKTTVEKGKTNEGDTDGSRFRGVIRPAGRESNSDDSDE